SDRDGAGAVRDRNRRLGSVRAGFRNRLLRRDGGGRVRSGKPLDRKPSQRMIDLGTGPIESSRRLILDEIGAPPDVALLRVGHTPGARLVLAGARDLLGGGQYRQIRLGQLAGEHGDTLLVAAGS